MVFPAAALLITTLAFNLLGDGIRDAMDPRTERLLAGRKLSRRKRRRLAADGRRRRYERGDLTPWVPFGSLSAGSSAGSS